MDIHDVIKETEKAMNRYGRLAEEYGEAEDVELNKAAVTYSNMYHRNRIILSALRAQQERENPKPLTEDELRARKNQPIYWYNIKKEVGDWRIVSKYQDSHDFIMFRDGASEVKSYGITWLAYDHEPAASLHPVIAEALEPFRPTRKEG